MVVVIAVGGGGRMWNKSGGKGIRYSGSSYCNRVSSESQAQVQVLYTHTNKAEDRTPAGHTGTFRVEPWPDRRHVAGRRWSQAGNPMRLDFKAWCLTSTHRTASLYSGCSVSLALTLTIKRSQSSSLQFLLTSKADLLNWLQRSL